MSKEQTQAYMIDWHMYKEQPAKRYQNASKGCICRPTVDCVVQVKVWIQVDYTCMQGCSGTHTLDLAVTACTQPKKFCPSSMLKNIEVIL